MEVEVRGAEQLEQLARRLRQVGDKGLNRRFSAGLNRAAKPLKEAAKASARSRLPARGGLAARVVGAKYSTRRRRDGIRITARAGTQRVDLEALDRGEVRHPVFGDRRVWVRQRVVPGWWTRPMQDGAPAVRRELERVMDEVSRELT